MNPLILGISTLTYALYIFSFPLSFYNDDSLFLARGIVEFSIIDFSPHFPGYVSLIILGKMVNLFINDANLTLFIISCLSAILIPTVIYFYVKELSTKKIALFSSLLVLSSPYLTNFSLSMLSDSFGFLFLLLSLYSIEKKIFKTAGVLLSIAFFARPSYIIFFIVGFVYLYFSKKESLKPLFGYFILGSLFFVLFIFSNHPTLYLYEAKRFIVGHFTIWGSGQFSTHSWLTNIFSLENLPFLLLIFCIKLKKELTLLYLLFSSYLVWIVFAQNPENLRHLVPVIIFSSIFIAFTFEKKWYVLVAVLFFNLYISSTYSQKLSPIDQIVKKVDNKRTIIVSNRAIEILREKEFIVLDKFYKSRVSAFESETDTLYITADEGEYKGSSAITGRFIGERPLFIKYK